MKVFAIVLALLFALGPVIMGPINPASAAVQFMAPANQTTLKLTYTPVQNSTLSYIGGEIRVDGNPGRTALSARYDTRAYDVAYHVRLAGDLNRSFGVFGGYGGVTLPTYSAQGFRAGAEVRTGNATGLYLAGDGAYVFTNPFAYDLRGMVGVAGASGLGLEAGYRRYAVGNLSSVTFEGPFVSLVVRR